MIRHALIAAAFLVAAGAAAGDDAAAKAAAKKTAEQLQTALVKGDYDKVADLTHRSVAEVAGGKKKLVEVMAAGLKEVKAKGFEFKAVKVADPSDPVTAGKVQYLVVPFDLDLTTPDGLLRVRGALVGVSDDGGKTWTFVDTAPGREAVKKFLPDLPDALTIPAKVAPKRVGKD